MTRIAIRLKEGFKVPDPTTRHPWSDGWIVGFVAMGDGVGKAVIQTSHDEFETVDLHAIEAVKDLSF